MKPIHNLSISILLCICTAAHSAVIYVNQNAIGANTGLNWTDAYLSLQDALDTVNFGDQVWVAQGTYIPSRQTELSTPTATTSDPRDATYWIPRGVQLFGGFAGNESLLQQRAMPVLPTILSGDLGIQSDPSDNSYRVVYYATTHAGGFGDNDHDQSIPARLDGFVVESANSDLEPGAGIYTRSSRNGDEIYNTRINIANCIIQQNTSAGNGGGLSATNFIGDIDNCQFIENSTDLKGGAIYLNTPTGRRFITNSTFIRNAAASSGGAVFCTGMPLFELFRFPIHFISNRFSENHSGAHGGAIAFSANGSRLTTLAIANCEFSRNTADLDGGAVWVAPGTILPIIHGAFADIRSSTFAYNTAQRDGGGVFAAIGPSTPSSATINIYNSILWGNDATQDRQANSTITMLASCIEDGGWTPLLGNISADPLFYDHQAHDYSLTNGSPAADTGINLLLPADFSDSDADLNRIELIPHDLRQRARMIDSGSPGDIFDGQPRTDMGAYELCSADINRDGLLNFFDISLFIQRYTDMDPDADINGDSSFNFIDISNYLEAFDAGCLPLQ